ncbi:sodium channel modifier 1 isoform X2 [Latimeria chalumnae]|uniref:sodium channel modifier 1 isoform X2 n=1 Tax=Latimeria chalumnae TaxID=7897 RepID=UPI0006D90CDE|nr:PREDICTED: sodium channel modifier 1 isoform X2 [Latimeria chalumnae]|eukprot:XP_014344134.1 PREDICTED: sodium channel modifier 1 isoform X2 [Latimeria chalumnae]
MSFKREGDDLSQLNVLKKRRVAELLSSYIPEDEALLLKNGRYACAVCSYRPVFDTLDMLTVHRTGKKHLAGLQKFYGKKHKLKNEIQKRQHEEFVRAEEEGKQERKGPAPLLMQTRKITHHALLKATPYNSCCQRNRQERSVSSSSNPMKLSSGAALQVNDQPSPAVSVSADPACGVEATSVMSLPGCSSSQSDMQKNPVRGSKKESRGQRAPVQTPGDQADPIAPEKRKLMEHYLRLKSG